MAPRTYIPMANWWANQLHKRLTKYQENLAEDATTEQVEALIDLITCLATFILRWPKPQPPP